jgi:hypothetical protein
LEKIVGGSTETFAESWSSNLTTAIKTGTYKADAASWLSGTTLANATSTSMIWARDANAYVCSTVMPNGVTVLESGDLSGAYYASVVDVVELQIAKGAGVHFRYRLLCNAQLLTSFYSWLPSCSLVESHCQWRHWAAGVQVKA